MAADIEKVYFAIQRISDGKLTCGYNSKTNGLYSSEGRARTQMNRPIRRYEKYMTFPHYADRKAEFQKYIDEHKANHRIIQVKVVITEDGGRIEKQ